MALSSFSSLVASTPSVSVPSIPIPQISAAGLQSAASSVVDTAKGAVAVTNSYNTIVALEHNAYDTISGAYDNVSTDFTGALHDLASGAAAAALTAGAGVLNDVLSMARAINLPAGADLFTTPGIALTLSTAASNDWRVRISTNWSVFDSPMFDVLENSGGVVWPYLPKITIGTKANYSNLEFVHTNYPFQVYKNSSVDDITIAGEFSAETMSDAAYWIAATTFFKSATKMFYGAGSNAGNPPVICNLTGYGSNIFNHVPVVIKSFSVELPDDVSYVKCTTFGSATWVPIISTISVSVTPVYNRNRLRQFRLRDYANGSTLSSANVGYF